jgi:hypothetical protein
VVAANSTSITLRFYASSSGGGSKYLQFGANSQFASNSGDVSTMSLAMQLVAQVGATAYYPWPAFTRRNSGGTIQAWDAQPTGQDVPQSDVPFIQELTFTNTTTGFYCPSIIFQPTSSSAYDFTVTLSQLQNEYLKSTRSSYIPNGLSASTTRVADVVTVNSPTTYFNLPQWTMQI